MGSHRRESERLARNPPSGWLPQSDWPRSRSCRQRGGYLAALFACWLSTALLPEPVGRRASYKQLTPLSPPHRAVCWGAARSWVKLDERLGAWLAASWSSL